MSAERSTNLLYDDAIQRVAANQAVVVVPSRAHCPVEMGEVAGYRMTIDGNLPKPWLSCWPLDRTMRRYACSRDQKVRAAFLIALTAAARDEATQAGLIFQD